MEEISTCAIFSQVRVEGNHRITRNIPFYNLDIIIAVGYRVNSIRGTQFRQWANKVLKEYLLRGYAVNQRFETLENKMDKKFAIHTTSHDRFLIIDDTEIYHIGASLKDLGKKLFAFSKLDIEPSAII